MNGDADSENNEKGNSDTNTDGGNGTDGDESTDEDVTIPDETVKAI